MTNNHTVKKMTILIVYWALIPFFTSCLSTQKYKDWVDVKTNNLKTLNEKHKDWLNLNFDNIEPKENVINKKKSNFIPALFYWEWGLQIECKLAAKTRLQYIKKGIYKAADKFNLKQLLNGKTLEIKLKKIPGEFIYEQNGKFIFLVFGYSSSSNEKATPKNQTNLEFEYLIALNGQPKANGTGVIENNQKFLIPEEIDVIEKNQKFFIPKERETDMQFIWLYLDQFEEEILKMSEKIILEILDTLGEK